MPSLRRSGRRDRSSTALSVLGNLLLVLATLAVAGLVAYLVLYPPGKLTQTSVDQPLPTSPSVSASASASTSAAPSGATTTPAQLGLEASCEGLTPLLDQTDTVATTATDDPAALDSETISTLARNLQAASGTAPDQLSALIDPLAGQLVELNNAVLAGEDDPTFDAEAATASTGAIRTLCEG